MGLSLHGCSSKAQPMLLILDEGVFAAKDGEALSVSRSVVSKALYSKQKQDQELTVAEIMNSLLPNSDLN